jgi:thermostable 8-oxoguanine DNA glycosylase
MVLQANIMLEEMDKLRSVGYKNIAIGDKHVNSCGDVMLSVR